ncbi:MAG: hypothetical protein V2A56_07385 [bacterium]
MTLGIGNRMTGHGVNLTWMHLSSASRASLRRRRSRPVMNVWVVLLVLGLVAAPIVALGAPSLSVTPKVARVGDPITIVITVPGARPEEIVWPTLEDGNIGQLTLLHADTVIRGRKLSRLGGPSLILTGAAYDTGFFSSGDFTMSVGSLPITLPAQIVTIASVLDDSTGLQLRPLKAQEDLPVTFNDLVRWFGPWIALAGILLIVWELVRKWLRRSQRKAFEAEQGIPLLSPYDEAMQALAELEKSNPLAKGDQKGYVTALSQITKRLLQRTHRAPVVEMTTYEVRRWLTDSATLCEPADLLKILEAGDHVKFAKGSLTADDAKQLLDAARRIVASYEPRELPEPDSNGSGDGSADAVGKGGSKQPGNRDPNVSDPTEGALADDPQPIEWRMHAARTGANRGRKPR